MPSTSKQRRISQTTDEIRAAALSNRMAQEQQHSPGVTAQDDSNSSAAEEPTSTLAAHASSSMRALKDEPCKGWLEIISCGCFADPNDANENSGAFPGRTRWQDQPSRAHVSTPQAAAPPSEELMGDNLDLINNQASPGAPPAGSSVGEMRAWAKKNQEKKKTAQKEQASTILSSSERNESTEELRASTRSDMSDTQI